MGDVRTDSSYTDTNLLKVRGLHDMAEQKASDTEDEETEQKGSKHSRRGFLKAAGTTAGAAVLTVAGCDTTGSNPGDDPGSDSGNNGSGSSEASEAVIDFGDDIGVLNYAYALEQLEARFYYLACKGENSPYEGISELERYYLSALDKHEGAHADFFRAAIPDDRRIPELEFDFSSVDFSSRDEVLSLAQVLEDTGVSAYNGAGRFLDDDTFLTLAVKIVSVESRHASAVRSVFSDAPEAFADLDDLMDGGFGADPGNALDAALPPDEVLARLADSGLVVSDLSLENF
jgi:hypothetical protein